MFTLRMLLSRRKRGTEVWLSTSSEFRDMLQEVITVKYHHLVSIRTVSDFCGSIILAGVVVLCLHSRRFHDWKCLYTKMSLGVFSSQVGVQVVFGLKRADHSQHQLKTHCTCEQLFRPTDPLSYTTLGSLYSLPFFPRFGYMLKRSKRGERTADLHSPPRLRRAQSCQINHISGAAPKAYV